MSLKFSLLLVGMLLASFASGVGCGAATAIYGYGDFVPFRYVPNMRVCYGIDQNSGQRTELFEPEADDLRCHMRVYVWGRLIAGLKLEVAALKSASVFQISRAVALVQPTSPERGNR